MKNLKGLTNHFIIMICFFLFVISTVSSNAQTISRSQIITNASPYSTFNWIANSRNIKPEIYCGSRYINTPSWVKTGTNSNGTGKNNGMPYCWGGMATISEFTTAIAKTSPQISAGDMCGTRQCKPQGDFGAGFNCVSGMDCSGFIQKAWGISGTIKKGTTDLKNLSHVIKYEQLQQGDMLYTSGHVRLVTAYNANGTITVLQASSDEWKVASKPYQQSAIKNSYTPYVYNNIKECAVPWGVQVPSTTITYNSAKVTWDATYGASNYQIGMKLSNASSYTYYTVYTNSATLTGLAPNTVYNVVVKASCSSNGTSSNSSACTFTTPSIPCSFPTGISTSNVKKNSAKISWSTITTASSYRVLWKKSSSSSWITSNVPSATCSLTSLSANTTYQYQVASLCGTVCSNYSAIYTFTTPSNRANYHEENKQYSSLEELILFPNPITPKELLCLTNVIDNLHVEMLSLDGKKVFETDFIGNCISLPETIITGVYLIKVTNLRNESITRKLYIK